MAEEKDLIFDEIERTKSDLSDNIASLGGQVRETVRQFNPSYQINQHPLLALSGSVLAGVVVGTLAGSRGGSSALPRQATSSFAQEFQSLKSAALGALFATIVDVAKEKFPQHAGTVEQFTDHLSGKKKSSGPPLRVV